MQTVGKTCPMPSSSLPPGPKLPSFGQGFVAARYPIAFLERCRRRYGDCFTMRFPFFGPVVYVADPGVVEELSKGDSKRFHAGEANAGPLGPVMGTQVSSTDRAVGAPAGPPRDDRAGEGRGGGAGKARFLGHRCRDGARGGIAGRSGRLTSGKRRLKPSAARDGHARSGSVSWEVCCRAIRGKPGICAQAVRFRD